MCNDIMWPADKCLRDQIFDPFPSINLHAKKVKPSK